MAIREVSEKFVRACTALSAIALLVMMGATVTDVFMANVFKGVSSFSVQ